MYIMSYDTIGVEVGRSVCEDLGNAWVVTVFWKPSSPFSLDEAVQPCVDPISDDAPTV
jgi:hypothetical protein